MREDCPHITSKEKNIAFTHFNRFFFFEKVSGDLKYVCGLNFVQYLGAEKGKQQKIWLQIYNFTSFFVSDLFGSNNRRYNNVKEHMTPKL